jgi:hypothetical protein
MQKKLPYSLSALALFFPVFAWAQAEPVATAPDVDPTLEYYSQTYGITELR